MRNFVIVALLGINIILFSSTLCAAPDSKSTEGFTISGQLFYGDGITPIGGNDQAWVEVYDENGSDGGQITMTHSGEPVVRMTSPSTYTIALSPTDIPTADKSLTLIYKLNNEVQSHLDGINAFSTRHQIADVSLGVFPHKSASQPKTTTITGNWTYKDGLTPIGKETNPKVRVTLSNGVDVPVSLVFGNKHTTYTATFTLPPTLSDRLSVLFILGDNLTVFSEGISGASGRTQIMDVCVPTWF